MATLSYLDNGSIRIGAFSDAGGAIGWLSLPGGSNLVNTTDLGREIQQSYYGSVPDPDGEVFWGGQSWPWNPVQAGDHASYPATVLEFTNDASAIYCKSIPKDWAANNRDSPGIMETWITLQGAVAVVRCKFTYTGQAAQAGWYQELPAVFVNDPTRTLWAYKGASPWTDDALSSQTPGTTNEDCTASERWWAYVDGGGQGLGVYSPIVAPGSRPGYPDSTNCTCYRVADISYLAPVMWEQFAPGSSFDYTFYLTVGTLAQIRSRFKALHDAGATAGPGLITVGEPPPSGVVSDLLQANAAPLATWVWDGSNWREAPVLTWDGSQFS